MSKTKMSVDMSEVTSGTIELLPARDNFSEMSTMNTQAPEDDFVARHTIPIESDMSTTAGLHVHHENAESHLQTLGGQGVSPSLAVFDNSRGVPVASNRNRPSNPNRIPGEIQMGPLQPPPIETLFRSVTAPAAPAGSGGGGGGGAHLLTPEELRRNVLQQLSAIRDQIDTLTTELSQARTQSAP